MQKQAKRFIMFLIAFACLIVGAITLPTPLPFGIVLLAVGFACLILASKTARSWMKQLRSRYPGFDQKLRLTENYLPRPLRRALRVSAPRTRTNDKTA